MTNFDFGAEHLLQNESVLLRPLRSSDYEFLLEYSLNEPETWSFNAFGAAGADNLRAYIERALANRSKALEYPFIVFDKKTGSYAGSTRFYDIQPEKKTIQIGSTWYGKNYRGSGLNKNCKYLLLEFAFEQLYMERVGFAANVKNERSIAAMKSIGCTVEGVLRSFSYDAEGNRLDAIVLSILKEEWETGAKASLARKISHRLLSENI